MKLSSRSAAACALALATASLSSPADAALVTFTDRTLFLAATTGSLRSIDFQALATNTAYRTLSSANAPSIPSGITFSSTGGQPNDLYIAAEGFASNQAFRSTSLTANLLNTPIIVDFAPTASAFGADLIPFAFGPTPNATVSVVVRETTGATTSFSVTPATGSPGFFGVIATPGTAIDRVAASSPGLFVGMDNVGFSNPVPEPATMAALGLGAIALVRRRKRA